MCRRRKDERPIPLLTLIPAVLAAGVGLARGPDLEVAYRNGVNLGATTIDQHGQSFTVTGLSGIAWAGGDDYLAVMDNSNKVVRLRLTLGADGSITGATLTGGVTLSESRDFEGIVAAGGVVFLSEEGSPGVHEYTLSTGARLRSLPVPTIYANRRSNRGFESLTRRSDGIGFWTANEEALTVDGPASSPTAGTLVRLLRYVGSGGGFAPAEQHAYLVDAMHGAVITNARSGLVELVETPSGRLIGMERSFALGTEFFRTRLYELTTAGATDVSGLASLVGPSYTRVGKRLMWQGDLTNLEGLCLGPALAGGGFALVGIIDDGDPISVNRVVAFRLAGPVMPICAADLNGDGIVDFNDLLEFLNRFNAQDPRADYNGDGVVDFNDFLEYLNLYNAGC